MVKRCLTFLSLALTTVCFAQSGADYANLHEDVEGLIQRVNDLSMKVEALEHENAELRAHAQSTPANVVTSDQLNAAIAQINSEIESSNATNKHEILEIVSTQMEKLAKQTNAALDTIANARIAQIKESHAEASAPAAASAPMATLTPSFKGGTSYTVQKGDTVALIAKKIGVHFQEIVSENKLADPSKIFVGQVLIIPSSK